MHPSPIVNQVECCPAVVMTAEAAVPGNTTQTTKSRSRKCCRRGMRAAGNLTVLLTLVLCLAPRSHCMPITPGDPHWWKAKCGAVEDDSGLRPAETEELLESFKRAKIQLEMAHRSYRDLSLEKMYSEVDGALEYGLRWLPERQWEWFEEKYGAAEIKISNMAPKVLFQLHKRLQIYAETIDRLYRHMHSEENTHFGRKRSKNLYDLRMELKKLLCEVEAFLYTAGKPTPSPSTNSSVIPEDKWDSRPDKTAVLVQDWGILNSYGKFLSDWVKIVIQLLNDHKNRKLKLKEDRKKRRRNRKRQNSQSHREERVARGQRNSSASQEARTPMKQRNKGTGKRKDRGREASRSAVPAVMESQ